MQRRIKRTIADAQHIVRHLIEPAADGPAVHGLVRQNLQKQKVQGALDEIARSAHGYRVEAISFPSVSKWKIYFSDSEIRADRCQMPVRRAIFELLCAQRNHRFYTTGSARRDPARQQRNA